MASAYKSWMVSWDSFKAIVLYVVFMAYIIIKKI
jgi:hypothetical protein